MNYKEESKSPGSVGVKTALDGQDEENTLLCSVCAKPSCLICTRCRSVVYCSPEHQKKDWKAHKKVCKSYEIKEFPESDRKNLFKNYCVASRDFKAGEIVLEEAPIFHLPEALDNGEGTPHCVTCGLHLVDNGNPLNCCSKCSWPVCSLQCEKASIHANNECGVFQFHQLKCNNSIWNFGLLPPFFMPNLVMAVRAAMVQKQEPELWKRLISIPLPGGVQTECFGCEYNYDMQEFFSILYRLLMGSPGKLLDIKLADMVWLGIYMTNLCKKQGFETRGSHGSEEIRRRRGTYVYKEASNFTHSCSPSCSWSISPFPDFKIRIRAAVPIKQGETITVSRMIFYEKSIYGTYIRQKIFKTLFGFQCNCRLCLDPTEFGTNMSAIICMVCRTDADKDKTGYGYVLPENPTCSQKNALWKCVRCGILSSFESYLNVFDTLLLKLDARVSDKVGMCNGKSKKYCEDLVAKYRDITLPPNHWLLLYAYKIMHLSIIQKYRNNEFQESDLTELESLSNVILSVLDIVTPGPFHEGASVIRASASALQYKTMDDFSTLLNGTGMKESKVRQMYESMKKCLERQKKAHQFYKGLWPPVNRKPNKDDDTAEATAVDIKEAKVLIKTLETHLAILQFRQLGLGVN